MDNAAFQDAQAAFEKQVRMTLSAFTDGIHKPEDIADDVAKEIMLAAHSMCLHAGHLEPKP